MIAAALLKQQLLHARQSGRLRGPRRLPRQQQPDRQREQYLSRLTPIVHRTFALVRERLEPRLPELVRSAGYRQDNWSETLDQTLKGIAADVARDYPPEQLVRIGTEIAQATSDFQRRQLLQQFREALTVDPVLTEPWLGDKIQSFTTENVRLIQSLPAEALDDLHEKLTYGVRRGFRAEDLAAELVEEQGITERRAAVIARDQVGKFASDLNRARQQDLGVDSYIWRGKLDNREREEHVEREGKRFSWDDPPEDGHPGEPVQCRCEAEPDLRTYWAGL